MSGAYWARRAIHTVIILCVVVTLNFFLPRLLPGSPAAHFAEDPRLSPEARQEILAQFGLDGPLYKQFAAYLRNLVRGDLGISFTYRRPVAQVIWSRIPWTLALTLSSFLVSLFLGVALGATAAWRRGGGLDTFLLSSAIVVSALPAFWIAMILTLLLAFTWPVLPAYGMSDPFIPIGFTWEFIGSVARHAVLPVISMSIGSIVGYGILVRNSMVEVTGEDYVRTARSKGLTERTVLYRHAFRNALLPLVTRIGMSLAGLIGGTTIIETIFSWEGMGLLVVEASRSLDYPLMQGTMLIMAVVTVLANFAADMAYSMLDPRVKYR